MENYRKTMQEIINELRSAELLDNFDKAKQPDTVIVNVALIFHRTNMNDDEARKHGDIAAEILKACGSEAVAAADDITAAEIQRFEHGEIV